jgi:DNA-binding transcriptional MerR regulator
MTNDSPQTWYTAKDITELLGISSDKLFHWKQTWRLVKPEIEVKGRAFKNKYSFKNLLDIAFIKELNKFGFEPSQISDIMKIFDGPDVPKEWRGSIWNYFKYRKEDVPVRDEKDEDLIYDYPGFEKAGFLILIYQQKEKYVTYCGDIRQVFDYLENLELNRKDKDASKGFLIINLLGIIRELEESTGEKL